MGHDPRKNIEPPDLSEKGGTRNGQPQRSDERLFMQLLAYGGCRTAKGLGEALEGAGVEGAVYEDANDPHGVAILTVTKDPNFFVNTVRPLLNASAFESLVPKPEYTMLGRTYAIGHEADLVEALIDRPQARVCDPALPWAIWYPLRRAGSFERLPREEQSVILMEHAGIGRAFGRAGLGYDIRLACHGLDKNDNDFVIGLLGHELHPLSVIIQRMRKTKQTSLHLDRLGPFFVGRAVWQPQR
jgi:chlorite dismutase